MRFHILIAASIGLAACGATEPELAGDAPETGQEAGQATGQATGPETGTSGVTSSNGAVRVGGGYRGNDDPCRRAGVTEVTAPFASSGEDLVACPVSFDGRPAFIQTTRAREVVRTSDWVVYSVPLFGDAPVNQFPSAPPVTGG